jgi:hypothetical protein
MADEQQIVSEPVVLDFEKDLQDVLKKHGFPDPENARYLIRSLDNLREYWREYASGSGAPVKGTDDNLHQP